MRKHLFFTMLAAISVATSFAQQTIPYSSAIGDVDSRRISSDWTVINANEDGATWHYENRDQVNKIFNEPCCALYQRSLSSPKEADDWLVSPAFHLNGNSKYKVSYWTFTGGFKENYEVILAKGKDLSPLTDANADTLKAVTDYMNFTDGDHNFLVFTPKDTADYYIAFHVSSGTNGYRLFIGAFDIRDFVLTPAKVGDLTATTKKDDYSVSLSWKLPTTDDCGDTLLASDIKSVNVYRGDSLVKTLDGTATSYVDTVAEEGFYTYKVAAVAAQEGLLDSVKTKFVGKLSPLPLPYTADFTSKDAVDIYWTLIDGNKDGITWKYYNEGYGTEYLTFANSRTDIDEDDWAISPTLHFPTAGKYKVTWNGYAYNGHLDFWIGEGKAIDNMAMKFGSIEKSQLKSFSRKDFELELNVPAEGDYNIGIHNNNQPSSGIDYYFYGFKVKLVEAETSGISNVTTSRDNSNNAIYSLQGIRLNSKPSKGIYISGGKKYVVK